MLKKIVILFILLTPIALQAKSRALLVGIGQYPGFTQLEGPVNDVRLVREVLLQSEQFNNENIIELLDEEATRNNILDVFHNIQKQAVSGDKVVLYFSGHGTSALNDNISADVPANSGALVPFDVEGVASIVELKNKLLIGRRDLRPTLIKLDNAGVEVLVLVDACFSGNVIRGNIDARTLPTKFLDFSDLLPRQFSSKGPTGEIDEPAALVESRQYPYQNVYLIAAAQENQYAQDIPRNRLEQFPTIDSKPHGAFTDSLVRTLAGLYSDNDKSSENFTLADLHVATRRLMIDRGFVSTPSLLPNNPARTSVMGIQNFFGKSVKIRDH